jgi:hypothetical protein
MSSQVVTETWLEMAVAVVDSDPSGAAIYAQQK